MGDGRDLADLAPGRTQLYSGRRTHYQEATIANSFEARPDRGGEALMGGAPAVLEPLEWETETLEEGARLFLDADFRFAVLPEAPAGRSFIRTSLFGTRATLRSIFTDDEESVGPFDEIVVAAGSRPYWPRRWRARSLNCMSSGLPVHPASSSKPLPTAFELAIRSDRRLTNVLPVEGQPLCT